MGVFTNHQNMSLPDHVYMDNQNSNKYDLLGRKRLENLRRAVSNLASESPSTREKGISDTPSKVVVRPPPLTRQSFYALPTCSVSCRLKASLRAATSRPGTTSICNLASAAATYVVGNPSSRRTMFAPWAMALAL
jgi:hypothetical protein